jgi:hypothetical protein
LARQVSAAFETGNVRKGSFPDIAASPFNVRFALADSMGQRNTF